MSKVYGIDPNQKITSLMIRDAIVTCFYEAHCADTGINLEDSNLANKEYCRSIIKKSFKDSGGDFDKPNKESILAVLESLVEFSKNFRDPSVIEKHYNEIMILMDKLEE